MGDSWYILGGLNSRSSFTYLDSTIVYTNGVFHPWYGIPYPASGACIIIVNGTHVFYAGGYDGSSDRSDAYLLEVDSLTWTSLPSMTSQRQYHSCGITGKNIIIVGGCCSEEALKTSKIFSLDSLTWTTGPGVPPTANGQFGDSTVY